MNVNQLAELLAQHIADGRGDDDVTVTLSDHDIDSRMQSVLDRYDWTVAEVRPDTNRSVRWLNLDVRPDK